MPPRQKKRKPIFEDVLLRRHLIGLGVHTNNQLDNKFDQDNGQVYMESTVRAIRPEDRNWIYTSEIQQAKFDVMTFGTNLPRSRYRLQSEWALHYVRYLELNRSRIWPEKGSKSLADMAITALVENIHDFELAWLDGSVSSKHVMNIWRQINRRCLANFATWKFFSQAIVRSRDERSGTIKPCDLATFDLYRFEHRICMPVLPLSAYAGPLSSPSFDFISFLSISVNSSFSELIQLKALRNLGALHLMYTNLDKPSNVNDRLLRAWSEAAHDEGAFPVLRILDLWGFRDVTIKSLEYASEFPALGLFYIRKCSSDFGTLDVVNEEAHKYKWILQRCFGTNKLSDRDVLAAWRKLKDTKSDFPGGKNKMCDKYKGLQQWEEEKVVRSMSDKPPKKILGSTTLLSFREMSRPLKNSPSWDGYMGRYYEWPWQADLHSRFTLLGRMRDDADLEKAGVKFRILERKPRRDGNFPEFKDIDQDPEVPGEYRTYQRFFVKDWQIPPVPIAALHLGEPEDDIPKLHEADDMLFVRIDIPTLERRETSTTPAPRSRKRPDSSAAPKCTSRLRPRKKMKVSDALDSFS